MRRGTLPYLSRSRLSFNGSCPIFLLLPRIKLPSQNPSPAAPQPDKAWPLMPTPTAFSPQMPNLLCLGLDVRIGSCLVSTALPPSGDFALWCDPCTVNKCSSPVRATQAFRLHVIYTVLGMIYHGCQGSRPETKFREWMWNPLIAFGAAQKLQDSPP